VRPQWLPSEPVVGPRQRATEWGEAAAAANRALTLATHESRHDRIKSGIAAAYSRLAAAAEKDIASASDTVLLDKRLPRGTKLRTRQAPVIRDRPAIPSRKGVAIRWVARRACTAAKLAQDPSEHARLKKLCSYWATPDTWV